MKLLWKTLLISGIPLLGTPTLTNAQSLARDSIPGIWTYASEYTANLPSESRWWEKFNDPILSELIKKGEENSMNLAATFHRIEIAKQNWETAKAAYFPTLAASGGYNLSQQSGAISSTVVPTNSLGYFSLGLNFQWEIDLFGKVANKTKAARANYNASKAEYSAAMISLCGNIATAYFNYRLAQCQIEVAQVQIASQEKINKIAEARYEAGLASKLDVAQALTVLYSTQATLPTYVNMKIAALNNLALLIGCYPDQISGMLDKVQDLPNAFHTIAAGVPADFLRRRPDVVQAEYQLAAYAAQAGIAEKDFLPTLSISGSLSTSSHKIENLFSKNSLGYNVSPQLSWTIFDGMARKHQLAAAKEQMMIGIDNYNLTLMSAVIETENALASYESSLRQIALFRKVLNESHEAFNLALDRYKRGLSDFTDVMNAQVSTLNYENTLLQTRAAALSSLVKVYVAVAGEI